MRTITLRTNVIAIFGLATLFSVCRLSAQIDTWAFLRTAPILVVGTIGGVQAEMSFHANAQVFDDGNATGTLQVRVVGGESFLYRVVQGPGRH
jgi:hypothetical protein